MSTGVTTTNVEHANLLDDILGNLQGRTTSVAVDKLATQLVGLPAFSAITESYDGLEQQLNADISALSGRVDDISVSGDTVTMATWTQLAAVAGARSGQRGYVEADTGTHADPVIGGTVQNAGIYTWSASPAGWRWLRPSEDAFGATVLNAVDPLTVSTLGTFIITNATGLPTGWPTVSGLSAILWVWRFGAFIIRDLRSLGSPNAEWRSNNGGAWLKTTAYKITADQLDGQFAFRGLITNADFDTLLDEGVYLLQAPFTHAPPGVTSTCICEVRAYGSFKTQIVRMRSTMDQFYQRYASTGGGVITMDPWYRIGGSASGGSGFAVVGQTMAVIGDSIVEFGDWPERIGSRFGMTVHKFGFGGCRMAAFPTSPNGYDKMSMYSIANNIASGDYTSLISGAAWCRDNAADDNTAQANAMAALDWSTVDYLLISYGTNDWASGVGLNGTLAADATGADFDGALAYAIEQIQAAYPTLKIAVISPAFRVRDVSTPEINSDNDMISTLLLTDYSKASRDVAQKYHVPWYDLYNGAGINRFNFDSYLADGTHPKPGIGYELWANKIGSWLGSIF